MGITLDATFLSASYGDGSSDSSSLFDGPPSDGYYDDGEPVLFADQVGVELQTSGSGAPTLSELLSEAPDVSRAGVLPPVETMTAEVDVMGQGITRTDGQEISGNRGSTNDGALSPGRGSRGRGGAARTGVFGLQGEGHTFVYVFDRSGSMDGHGGAPLLAAKTELINSLRDLDQVHQFQIIFYNDEPRIFTPQGNTGRLVFGTNQNKALAQRFVGSITASGATRHLEALEMAVQLGPDVIFFLTDADEPRMMPHELAKIAQMNRGTTIHTIEFGTAAQGDADNFISRLARQNGGQHVYIDVTRLNARRF